MKKLLKVLFATFVTLTLVACSSDKSEEENLIKVSATLDPHATILEFIKPILLEDYGYELEIIVLDDYFIFNRALDSGDVLANYFQHVPFFEGEVEANGYDIVNAAGIHIEPFGLYSNEISDLSELKDGDKIIIGNSVADHGRILTIFENLGLIKLDENVVKNEALTSDIVENNLNLEFLEIKPELLYTALVNNEGAIVAINGNYALANDLVPIEDALVLEEGGQDNPYVNILAVQSENIDDPRVKALVEVLKSDDVKDFINDTYQGSVIVAE